MLKLAGMLGLLMALGAAGEGSISWITMSPTGRLAYVADPKGNIIPDFSNCGYRGGGVSLPKDVAVKATVGSDAGSKDDTARIQAAIDEVSKLPLDSEGHRGAVLLKKGTYRIAGALKIQQSGVVLRGEGDGEDGTVLIATGTNRRALIQAGGKGADHHNDDDEKDTSSGAKNVKAPKGAAHRVLDSYVPVGARMMSVENAAGFAVGQNVIVHRPSTAEWIHALGMDHIPPRKDGGKVVQWSAGSKDLNFDRIITAIDGNKITLDAPITCALDSTYGGGDVHVSIGAARIKEVGIESLRGVSEFKSETDEDHSWSLISMSGVENGWVKKVTSEKFAFSLVTLTGESKWVTVQDCTCLDPVSQITGGRRYSFCMTRCQLCLVQRCAARNGRHDFVMGATVAGPNVFLDCKAEKTHADAGPHHRWSVGTLYDGLSLPDGQINIQDRGSMGSGHGWAGANQVVWNCVAKSMIVSNPPTAMNWAIGGKVGERKGNGIWESVDSPMKPKSLYLEQLRERLGEKAVESIRE